MLQRELDREVGVLLSSGLWATRDQLPSKYTPGLRAQPWHDPQEYAGFPAAKALLERSVEALTAEFGRIEAAGLLEPDYECIHAAKRGGWSRFSVNAPWQPK